MYKLTYEASTLTLRGYAEGRERMYQNTMRRRQYVLYSNNVYETCRLYHFRGSGIESHLFNLTS